MSCKSMHHRFEEEKRKGLDFEKAIEMYRDVEGSIRAHKIELQELQHAKQEPEEISHLQEHITEGEKLLQEIKTLRVHYQS
ncbi:MAG: hypothetical protein CVU88_07875 [Firmicutes bacterium HGW-Firmicutes-13]|nr:MAG: hypothetical protein CVU88_07875 [Firmicutes bacterium HGW-Firmicutes-13]